MVNVQQLRSALAPASNKPNAVKLATITRIAGRPYVTFDEDDAESQTTYAYNASVVFGIGDRVVMQPISGTYIIAYKII